MSFDGFNFGFGGVLPQIFGGFFPLIYQILFQNTFNQEFNVWFSGVLPNRIDPIDFLPESNRLGIDLRNRYGRDVVSLVGQDWADQILASVYTRPSVKVGDKIPSGCVGPTYQLRIDGGRCTVNREADEVDCTPPSIRFQVLPLTCNLKYKSACALAGDSWRLVQRFGRVCRDVIGPRAAIYNYGYALNVTQVFLGFGLNTQRLLQDFGVTRWYNYLSAIIGLELVRIIDALLGGFAPFFFSFGFIGDTLGALGAQNLAGQPGGAISPLTRMMNTSNVSPRVRGVAEWLQEKGLPWDSSFFRPSAGTMDSSTLEVPYKPPQTTRNGYKSDAISTVDLDKLMYNQEQMDKLQGNFHVTPGGQRRLDFQQYALDKMTEAQEEVNDIPQPADSDGQQQPLADHVFVTRASDSASDPDLAGFLGLVHKAGGTP